MDLRNSILNAFALGMAVLFLLGGKGPVPDVKRYEYRQVHMGMEVRLVLYAASDTTARQAARAAFQRVAGLESVLSSYRSDSEISRLVRHAGGSPVPVSDALFTVLKQAQELAHRSDGAFDVAVGPYVALWREARRTDTLPSDEALRRAGARVGWQYVRLDTAAQTVELLRPGMELTLGGIAKGYILDRALAVLTAHGIERALVEAGGDLVLSGPPPDSEGWRVKLPHAAPGSSGPRVVTLTHAAVATSGDTMQFAFIDGTRYSHVIDPRTGLGLTSHTLTTVIAPTGLLADGLATTLGVLGAEEGRALLEAYYPRVRAFIRKVPALSPPG